MMKRLLALIMIFPVLLLLPGSAAAQKDSDPVQQEQILSAAENFFVFVKHKNYAAVWSTLSAKSQSKIINDVRKESKKAGVESTPEALRNDFMSGGIMAKAYWDNFLFVFNPDMVLKECKWEMGKIKSSEAEIVLQYKKSEKPALLKMVKENNAWKFGLNESFGARDLSVF
ncbi:MAG: hypothetical protein STSR0003_01600 [Smithella sp.]|jgi:hypothetical protein